MGKMILTLGLVLVFALTVGLVGCEKQPAKAPPAGNTVSGAAPVAAPAAPAAKPAAPAAPAGPGTLPPPPPAGK